MGQVVLSMAMSLDGYINDLQGSAAALIDLDALHASTMLRESIDHTGAVIMGKHTYGMVHDPDWYAENYEYQVPLFVVTDDVPEKQPKGNGALTITFVTDGVESAVRQAQTAAGDKDIIIAGGAKLAQELLAARLVDVLHVGVVAVLLGGGTRLFGALGQPVQLEKLKVLEKIPGRTDLVYKIVRM